MNVLFCWSDISGYMTACWKALAAIPEVNLHVFAFGNNDQTQFNLKLTGGLEVTFVDREPEYKRIKSKVKSLSPEVIVLCGWFVPAYRKLPNDPDFKHIQFILAMDTPWWGTPRQQLARVLLKNWVGKMYAVMTSGERSYQYARRLGAKKILKAQYGVDVSELSKNLDVRLKSPWPKRFLYVGRYAPEKGLERLMEAYRKYRSESIDPWELHACGKGPLDRLLVGEGIQNHGFVQPQEIRKIWQQSGCLVLPSTFDPWPLIVVEACAAGLPVICTHASGSQVEVVKMYWNGLVINANNTEELLNALKWMDTNYDKLSVMGGRSFYQAQPYDAVTWSHKFIELTKKEEC